MHAVEVIEAPPPQGVSNGTVSPQCKQWMNLLAGHLNRAEAAGWELKQSFQSGSEFFLIFKK